MKIKGPSMTTYASALIPSPKGRSSFLKVHLIDHILQVVKLAQRVPPRSTIDTSSVILQRDLSDTSI